MFGEDSSEPSPRIYEYALPVIGKISYNRRTDKFFTGLREENQRIDNAFENRHHRSENNWFSADEMCFYKNRVAEHNQNLSFSNVLTGFALMGALAIYLMATQ